MSGRWAIFVGVALMVSAQSAAAHDECADVPSCVELARRSPATFTNSLKELVQRLPAPVLLVGLHWTAPPEDAERIRGVVRNALETAQGQTAASAHELLEMTEKGDGDWLLTLSF